MFEGFGAQTIDTPTHRTIALEASQQAIILLQNNDTHTHTGTDTNTDVDTDAVTDADAPAGGAGPRPGAGGAGAGGGAGGGRLGGHAGTRGRGHEGLTPGPGPGPATRRGRGKGKGRGVPLLPLAPGTKLALIGPHVRSTRRLLSIYAGDNVVVESQSPEDGIRRRLGRSGGAASDRAQQQTKRWPWSFVFLVT